MTTLRVNPPVLRDAATTFGQAATGLGGLHADAPLGEVAGAVSGLRTADACLKAQADVANETNAAAGDARKFGENLTTAAQWYEKRDQAAAEAIKKIEIPR